jgi:uncharacterized protein (TIGR04255 family)
MKFLKPPVVEVWISVEFDPNQNKREWDMNLVQQYVRQYAHEFPKQEVLLDSQIQIQAAVPNEIPKVVSHDQRVQALRLWNEARTRLLQIGDDKLAYHMVKENEDTPGYRKVRDAAQTKLEDYIRIFQPSHIRNATLHYLDIVEIPVPDNGKLDLKDYFAVSVDLPEDPFGLIASQTHQFAAMCSVDPGPLYFQLQTVPSQAETKVFRFQMEWHKQCSDVNSLDLPHVFARMDVAHEYMRQCFSSAFTRRALALFGPIEEAS